MPGYPHIVSEPVRTCIGCRGRAAKRDLFRVVWGTPGVRPDPRQVEPGRGAYLHRDERCLDLAVKRKALGRALRLTGSGPDPDSVRAALASHLS